MPWTFAHPAAVLPLRRLGPVRLNLAALAIGSMTPDFGYYVFQFQGTSFAHTFTGSLTVCLALGLALLLCFHMVRRPLCYMLPQPHREVLMRQAAIPLRFEVATVVVAMISVVLGAWTHILWDSFTHADRWFVERIGWLNLHVLTIRGHVLYGYSLLQYLSSIAGIGVLLWTYWNWLRTAHGKGALRFFEPGDGWRYGCMAGAVVLAALIAVPWAISSAASTDGLFALRTFVVRSLVGTTSLFAACFVTTALICYWRRPRLPDP